MTRLELEAEIEKTLTKLHGCNDVSPGYAGKCDYVKTATKAINSLIAIKVLEGRVEEAKQVAVNLEYIEKHGPRNYVLKRFQQLKTKEG